MMIQIDKNSSTQASSNVPISEGGNFKNNADIREAQPQYSYDDSSNAYNNRWSNPYSYARMKLPLYAVYS